MTDRTKCTRPSPLPAPKDWENHAVFRETFLRLHLQPEDATNLRTFGRWLYATALEPTGPAPDLGESITQAELRAAAADLNQLQGFLADTAEERQVNEMSAEDVRLAELAAELAVDIEGMVGRIGSLID